MSDFISEYGEQLRHAGWRCLDRRRRFPRVLGLARPTRRVVVALIALSVAAPAVTATVVWRPLLGDGRPDAPTASTAPAAERQRAILSVLRRPQEPADRGAQSRYALKFLSRSVADVRTTEIRLLHVEPDGRGIVLIPVGRYGLLPDDAPESMRERRRTGADGLCLFAADQENGRPAGGGFGCYGTQALLANRAAAGLGDRAYGLVPDGVASIEVVGDGMRITADVKNNFYIYTGSTGAGEMRWLDKRGDLVKSFPGAPDLPMTPLDPPMTICDASVPAAQCRSGLWAGPDGIEDHRPGTPPPPPPDKRGANP